ncbi:MAG: hypothetical protein K0S32_2337 [Bacteroidetes bacterium]|jgi:hypothetical protein|nr:hypothetical protein [Bacteroidota bacterium]
MKQAVIIFSLACALQISAQDHHITMDKKTNSLCLKECFTKAEWEFHNRTFFMATINEGALKDDYALASGAGLRMLTFPFKGFQAGVSGFFTYNVFSSELFKPDSLTGLLNRYEAGLFDIENYSNKSDLDRLEELYLKYTFSKSSITIGKINLNTPFFNPQDGRMRPTLEEGVWLSILESKKIAVSGGWIWDVSPRSTVRWFTVAKSIGVYPVGINSYGNKSSYAGEIEGNSGMGIINLHINSGKNIKINLWNSFLENVMNTAIIEIKLEQKKGHHIIYENALFIHQDALNNGGNADPLKTYMDKGSASNAVSVQVGLAAKKINTSINYTHITGDGRYLMPREWGREPFYTFLPRERNEGLGNVHAFMGKIAFTNAIPGTGVSLAYGYYQLPNVQNFRLNKYGLPSYHQVNLEINYMFEKVLKGLQLKALIAGKLNQGEIYNNLKYLYNKVDMLNFNLIMDFKI